MATRHVDSDDTLDNYSLKDVFMCIVPNVFKSDLRNSLVKPTGDYATVYKRAATGLRGQYAHLTVRNIPLFALHFNNAWIKQELEDGNGDSLFSTFFGTIDVASGLHPLISKHLKMNAILYLLLLLSYPHSNQVPIFMNRIFPSERQIWHILDKHGIKYNTIYLNVMSFIESYQVQFVDFASERKDRFNAVIYSFYKKIYDAITAAEYNDFERENCLHPRLGKMRSYVPKEIVTRLLILSFSANGRDNLTKLQHKDQPRCYIYSEVPKFGTDIPFSLLSYALSKYVDVVPDERLETLMKEKRSQSFEHFTRIVYGLHQISIYKGLYPVLTNMRSLFPDDFMEEIEPPEKIGTLMKQYIVLQYPNWQELWRKFRWPMYPTLMRRIEYIMREGLVTKFDNGFCFNIMFASLN